ncbi:TAXI family TRAP transporter solute-binding subunit [Devosia naphthalenivorans]|uniref:TAXI family TRAP transporter solute-binding subunit n=1 Tax=Devosia naphthalenivorans TaxID=2082392 RepID=UPI000D378492|nr:TAXI family TRAP transporter solute-binding subunit [Devosia naphthalenivorans]
MKTQISTLFGAAAMAITMVGAGQVGPAAAQERAAPTDIVLIGRGSTGSTSDLVMAVLEESITRSFPDIRLRRLPGSATAVPPKIEAGEAEIGHGVGETLVQAWLGNGEFEGDKPMKNLRYLGGYLGFLVRPSAGPTLVVPADSSIQSWHDLSDKRIGVGVPTSLNSTLVDVALHGIDLSYEKIEQNGGLVVKGDWNQQFEAMGDGQLDGVFVLGDQPSALVTQYAANNQARLISVPEEAIDAIIADYPTTTRNSMQPGTYEWQAEEVRGIRLTLGFVVHKDLPEEFVYQICKQLYTGESANIWGEVVPSWRGAEAMKEEAAAAVPIPLHPGAQRCFEEAGIPITYVGSGGDAV